MSTPQTTPGPWWKALVNFFILGLVVFGLRAWFEKPATSTDTHLIEISSAEIDWFRTMWKKRMGREPTLEEMQGQVAQLIREQVLSREAVMLGLDESDQVVQRRLAQRMDYLLKDLAAGVQPTDDELEAFLENNRSRYEIPGASTFEQVFFTAEQRGLEGAERAAASFTADSDGDGDATLLPRYNEKLSPAQISGLFGEQFAAAIREMDPGGWRGPVHSTYGVHAVRITERSPAVLPAVSDIRERLIADWSSEQQAEAALKAYSILRNNYQVLVEGMPYTTDMK